MVGSLPWHLMGFICFTALFGHNGLYMMTPHPCRIQPWSWWTHTFISTHTRTCRQLRSMVINLIPDKYDTCTHEAFGHSFSLLTTAYATHTDDFFPLPPLSLLSLPWHTCQGPHWPLTPAHLAPLLIFFFPLRPSQSRMKVGESGRISRHSQV